MEGQDGRRLEERQGSPEEFRRGLRSTTWDELQLAHYCGYLIWNHIATPFHSRGFRILKREELRRNVARGEGLRRLSSRVPGASGVNSARKRARPIYFDREGLLRRLDYPAAHDDHTQIAQMFSGHQRFSGMLVPTLCRLLSIGAEGVPVAKPSAPGRRNLRCSLRVSASAYGQQFSPEPPRTFGITASEHF